MVTITENTILRSGSPTNMLVVKSALFGVLVGLAQPELLALPFLLLLLLPLFAMYILGCAYHQASLDTLWQAVAFVEEIVRDDEEDDEEGIELQADSDEEGYSSSDSSDEDEIVEMRDRSRIERCFKAWCKWKYGEEPRRVFTHPCFAEWTKGIERCTFLNRHPVFLNLVRWHYTTYGPFAYVVNMRQAKCLPFWNEFLAYMAQHHAVEPYFTDEGFCVQVEEDGERPLRVEDDIELQGFEDAVDIVNAGAKSLEASIWNLKLIAAFALTSKFLTSRSKFVKFSCILGLWQLYTTDPPSTQIEQFIRCNINLLMCAVAYCHNLIEKVISPSVKSEIEIELQSNEDEEVVIEEEEKDESEWKAEFEKLWPEGQKVEGIEKHRGIISIAALAIGIVGVTLGPGIVWLMSEKTTFGNGIIELGKTITAKNIIWSEVKKTKDNILWLLWKCCGKTYIPDDDKEAQTVQNMLMTHMKDLAAYEKLLASDFFGAMRSNKLDTISKGIEKTEDLLGKLSHVKRSQYNLTTILTNIKTGYEDLLEKRLNLITNAIGKQEPVVIHLCGPPGHGKSEFMKNFLVKNLEREYGISAYFRNAHDEYWSRFAGQQILVWDDIGFKKDGADYAEFCYHTSGAPSSAIGAAIKEKGRPTNPLFIIVTSNEMYLGTQGHELTTPNAFHRRRDVVIGFYNEKAANYLLEKGETIPPSLYDESATALTVYRPVPKEGDPSRNVVGRTDEKRLWNYIVEKEKLNANHFKKMLRQKKYYKGSIPEDTPIDSKRIVIDYLVDSNDDEMVRIPRSESREDIALQLVGTLGDMLTSESSDELARVFRDFQDRATLSEEEAERVLRVARENRDSIPNLEEFERRIPEVIEEQSVNPSQQSISQKKPCIVISGPSGVGKTHMANVFCQRVSTSPMVRVQATDLERETDYTGKVLFVDDITMSKEDYLKAIKYSNFFYEMNLPKAPLAVIFTQNDQKLKHVADDSMVTELRRRSHCVDISFHWTWTQLFWTQTQLAISYKERIRSANPKAKCMNESLCAYFTPYEGKRVSALASEITSLLHGVYSKIYGDEIQTSKLWTLPLPKDIDFTVNLKRTIRECAELAFNEVFGSIVTGSLFSIHNVSHKFNVTTAMSMVVDIFRQAPYRERDGLDDFVTSFNEAEITSVFRPPGTAIITTPEGHVGLTWVNTSIRMFKITDDPVALAGEGIDIHRYFDPNVDSIYKSLVSRMTFSEEAIARQQERIDEIQSQSFVKTSLVCKLLQSILSICMIVLSTAGPISLVKDMMTEMEDRNELTYLRKVHEVSSKTRNAGFRVVECPEEIWTAGGSVPIEELETILRDVTLLPEQKKRICLDNQEAAIYFAHQRDGGDFPILWKLFKEHMYIPITPSLESIDVRSRQSPTGVYGEQRTGRVVERRTEVAEEYLREDEDHDGMELDDERTYAVKSRYVDERAERNKNDALEKELKELSKRYGLADDYLTSRTLRWEDESAPDAKKKFVSKSRVESAPKPIKKVQRKTPVESGPEPTKIIKRKVQPESGPEPSKVVKKKIVPESGPEPKKVFKKKISQEGRVDITPEYFSLDQAIEKAREYEGDVYLYGSPNGFASTTGKDTRVAAMITREYTPTKHLWAVVIVDPEQVSTVVPQLESEIDVAHGDILRIRRLMANHEYWHYGIVGPSPSSGEGPHLYHVQSAREADGSISAYIAVDPISQLELGWEPFDKPIYTKEGFMYVPVTDFEFLRDHAFTKFPYNVNSSNCETWALSMRYGHSVIKDANLQRLPSYFVSLLEIAATFTDMKERFQEIREATEKIQTEACADPGALSVVRDTMPPNAVFVHSAATGKLLSRGLGIRNRCVLINHHTKGEEFLVVRWMNGQKLEAKAVRAWDDPATDLSLIRIVEPQFPAFKDISSKFMTVADMKKALGEGTDSVAMLNVPMDGKFGFYMHCSTLRVAGQLNNIFTGDRLLKGVGLAYTTKMVGGEGGMAVTEKGDCGSAVVLFNNRINKKIVGIHRAGSETKMYVALVPQEKLLAALNEAEMDEESFDVEEDCIMSNQCVDIDEATGFPMVGFSKFASAKTRGTKLRLNPIEIPSAPCDGEPAILGPQDPRSNGYEPALTTLANFPLDPKAVDKKELRTVADEIVDYLSIKLRPLGVLTRTEAINGPSKHRYPMSGSLDRKTSPGFPHVFRDKTTTKQSYFKQMVEKDGSELWRVDLNSENGKRLDKDLSSMLSKAHQGERPNVVFSYFPKDEVLAKRKIITPKTRGILASNVPYVIAYRQYFLALHLRVQECFKDLPIKVGIDPHVDWNELAQYHLAKGNLGFDADAKNWDASVPVEFLEECAYIANRLYQKLDPKWKEQDDIVRSALHACVERPYILYNRKVIQTFGGQVSGQPGTAFDNSLINWMLVAIIYKRIMMKSGDGRKATFSHFMKDCALSVYGDDMIVTMGAASAEHFTIDKYAEEAEKFGFTITAADKASEITNKQSKLEEMTFLKRSFKKIERVYVGPIEFASIGKSLKWIKGSGSYFPREGTYGTICWKVSDDLGIIRDNFENQLVEASLHGEITFHAIRNDMNRGLREHNMDPITTSFNGALAQAGALLIEGRNQPMEQSEELSSELGQNLLC